VIMKILMTIKDFKYL